MTYHLPRIFEWISNGSLEAFPTSIPRQVQLNPFAEFVGLNFYLLSGGWESSFNLVQWMYFLAVLSSCFFISRELGISERGSYFAVLFASTIPMGILQSNSTQNDIVAGFWLMAAIFFLFNLRRTRSLKDHLLLGLSIGLGINTKGTLFVFFIPILLLYIFWVFKFLSKGSEIIKPVLLGLLILLINTGYWYRNYQAFGGILGEPVSRPIYFNSSFGIRPFTSNLIRNTGQLLAISEEFSKRKIIHYPISKINGFFDSKIKYLHEILNIPLNDPNSSWPNTNWSWGIYSQPVFGFHEDYAPAPIHTFFFILLPFLFFFRIPKREWKNFYGLFFILILGYFSFSFFMRWQPWHARLTLPLFFVGAPLMGAIVSKFQSRIILLIFTPFVLYSFGPSFLNESRKILSTSRSIIFASQDKTLFSNKLHLLPDYRVVKSYLSFLKPKSLGLNYGGDSWEYPIWRISKNLKIEKIQHIRAYGPLAKFLDEEYRPDLIFGSQYSDPKEIPVGYDLIMKSNFQDIYARNNFSTAMLPVNYFAGVKTNLQNLAIINTAVKKFKLKYGHFPVSVGWEGLFCNFCPATYNRIWIRGLVPEFLHELPRDIRIHDDPERQYIYSSNGEDYKLISHHPLDVDSIILKRPDLVDPVRAYFAYGFWTEHAKDW